MKKLMMAAVAAACLMPMASEATEDRVNLWPLFSAEKGEYDFIWPLGHVGRDGFRFFPLICERDMFCLFPELWYTDDIFAILPLVVDHDFSRGTLFPVVWWDVQGSRVSGTFHSLFPLYYYGWDWEDEESTFWAACGLVGRIKDKGKTTAHWLLPLYVKNGKDFVSIPYSLNVDYDGSYDEFYIGGLAGRSVDKDGGTFAHWTFPLWYWNETDKVFVTLPYCRSNDEWSSPLALSWGKTGESESSGHYLLGLGGYEKTKENFASWCVPFYYADTKGTLITLPYGQSADAKWGLPGWYADASNFVSPLWYHHRNANGDLDRWMMPLALSAGAYTNGERWDGFLLNLAGRLERDDGYRAHWGMPLYFWDNDDTFITALYGRHKESQWCFPVWYNDDTSFYSLPWCQRKNKDGSLASFAVPWLLSGYSSDGVERQVSALLGLGGAKWNARSGERSSWMFPFYYEDNRDGGSFITPLAGKMKESTWFLPAFYADKDTFVSLPYMRMTDTRDGAVSSVVPPLLSGYTRYPDGSNETVGMLLYGHKNKADGTTERDYLLPLYYKGEDRFLTPIVGVTAKNSYWLTPLVGTYGGEKSGGWVFPLFNSRTDRTFDDYERLLDARELPADIVGTNETLRAEVRGSVCLFSDFDKDIRIGKDCDNASLSVSRSSKRGNKLLFNSENRKTVYFDKETRKKTSESGSSDSCLLGGVLYAHESRYDTVYGRSKSHTRILWKLWEREEKNGDVTIDAFPGFTHDSRKDGYSKTSFLWRFFRYENDPKRGVSVDLFFLPIWRP